MPNKLEELTLDSLMYVSLVNFLYTLKFNAQKVEEGWLGMGMPITTLFPCCSNMIVEVCIKIFMAFCELV